MENPIVTDQIFLSTIKKIPIGLYTWSVHKASQNYLRYESDEFGLLSDRFFMKISLLEWLEGWKWTMICLQTIEI